MDFESSVTSFPFDFGVQDWAERSGCQVDCSFEGGSIEGREVGASFLSTNNSFSVAG